MTYNQTQTRIFETFASMLDSQTLAQIQVRELCYLCSINRSTFYRYFKDTEDLKDQFESWMLAQFHCLQIFPDSADWTDLFVHISQHQPVWKAWFALGLHQKYCAEELFADPDLSLRTVFFIGGLAALIQKWLTAGCLPGPASISAVLKQEYAGRLVEDGIDPFSGLPADAIRSMREP